MPPMMPLRRTASSPSVRPAPYTYTSLSSASTAGAGNQPRRSSGSDTASRRVLADLDWWRVQDGQHAPAAPAAAAGQDENGRVLEREAEGVPAAEVAGVGADEAEAGAGVAAGWGGMGLDMLLGGLSVDTLTVNWHEHLAPLSPLPEFAALSIAPRTPTRAAFSLSPTPSPTGPLPASLTASPIFPQSSLGVFTAEPTSFLPPTFAMTLDLAPSSPPRRAHTPSALAQRRARPGLAVRAVSASYAELAMHRRTRAAAVAESPSVFGFDIGCGDALFPPSPCAEVSFGRREFCN